MQGMAVLCVLGVHVLMRITPRVHVPPGIVSVTFSPAAANQCRHIGQTYEQSCALPAVPSEHAYIDAHAPTKKCAHPPSQTSLTVHTHTQPQLFCSWDRILGSTDKLLISGQMHAHKHTHTRTQACMTLKYARWHTHKHNLPHYVNMLVHLHLDLALASTAPHTSLSSNTCIQHQHHHTRRESYLYSNLPHITLTLPNWALPERADVPSCDPMRAARPARVTCIEFESLLLVRSKAPNHWMSKMRENVPMKST